MDRSTLLMITLAVSQASQVALKQTLPEDSSKYSTLDPEKQVFLFFFFPPLLRVWRTTLAVN